MFVFAAALILAAPSPAAATIETAEPVAVVRSFHAALAAGDREKALAALDPAVIVFEQGGAEMSREEYASRHLPDDIEFSRQTTSKVVQERSDASGDRAWVSTLSDISGSFNGKPVAVRSAETVVLKRTPSGWKIVHVHWSSHRRE